MSDYWFWRWIRDNGVEGPESLRRALGRSGVLDRLVADSPETVVTARESPPAFAELTGGKGIDLTGDLGCHHIECLSKEIDGLFRHTWHYFDQVALPDQAHARLLEFQRDSDVDRLARELGVFAQVLKRLNEIGGLDLVRFEVRRPPCPQHFRQHAKEAQIEHAFDNLPTLAAELSASATMTWNEKEYEGHRHLDYRLESAVFDHTEWGSICSKVASIPDDPKEQRETIAQAIIGRYLAALSADALAARISKTPLGATIPYFHRLLGSRTASSVDAIAFELQLPVAANASVEALIRLRRDEADSFSRFQLALRSAITERLKSATSARSDEVAVEIRRDILEPELHRIQATLSASKAFSLRGAATGVGLGTIAATVGLLAPPALAIGTGLAVGGAITLGAQALKKANDDYLATLRDVQLSDMYFLWKAHTH